jgi:hypothetical protein
MSKIIQTVIRGESSLGNSLQIAAVGQVVGFRMTNASFTFGSPSGVNVGFGALDGSNNPVQVTNAELNEWYSLESPVDGVSVSATASGSGVGSTPFWVDIEVVVSE